jgi:GNAT superfamily N-acetyltransferase
VKQKSIDSPPEPPSVRHLELTRERSRKTVNQFLDNYDVDHDLGSVTGWRACFGARYCGTLYAVVTVGRPVSGSIDDDKIVEINRFATRPERPANTGSWLIAKARDWAELEGYEKIISYAGVGGNDGTLYTACGFELVGTTQADGSSWTHREDREEREDFERRKYVYELGGIARGTGGASA